MQTLKFCIIGESSALTYARNQLESWGYDATLKLDRSVTHVLLPVPSLDGNDWIIGGPKFEELLNEIHEDTIILGGNLPIGIKNTVDFLKDEYYTAENAFITAQCALTLAMQNLKRTIIRADVLLIGWGRIGKCLAEMLHAWNVRTTVAVRKEADRALLEALGYQSTYPEKIDPTNYDVIINTVPTPILHATEAKEGTILIDLASSKGILGDPVIWARGLPGKMAPVSSGALIAKTALRYALGKE